MTDLDVERLRSKAQEFTLELTHTVRSAFGPGVPAFLARVAPEAGRVSIHQDPNTGLVLTVGGVPRLVLKVRMDCWPLRALKVAESKQVGTGRCVPE